MFTQTRTNTHTAHTSTHTHPHTHRIGNSTENLNAQMSTRITPCVQLSAMDHIKKCSLVQWTTSRNKHPPPPPTPHPPPTHIHPHPHPHPPTHPPTHTHTHTHTQTEASNHLFLLPLHIMTLAALSSAKEGGPTLTQRWHKHTRHTCTKVHTLAHTHSHTHTHAHAHIHNIYNAHMH